MDAELCRRAARVMGSPYWFYTANQYGGKPSSRFQEYSKRFTDVLVSSKTFSALDSQTQRFIELCEQSEVISSELFDGKGTTFLTQQELEQIVNELIGQYGSEVDKEEE
jgi:hypothetical protein